MVDRPESYDSNRANNRVFIAHENMRGGSAFISPFSHTICPKEFKASKISPDIYQLTSFVYISNRPNQLPKFKLLKLE
jgi:hypothetical protein